VAQDPAAETPAAEMPAAETPAPDAAPVAGSTNLVGDVEDFWHFAKIARYDAANAKAAAIIAAGAQPLEVLTAFENAVAKRPGDDLTAGMVRFVATPEIEENAKALEKILIEGRYARRGEAKFIESNIQRLIVNAIGYQNGVANLKSSGEMAVPILLDYLRTPERSQYHDAVRRALRDLGRVALNPLLAATETSDTETLGYIVSILGDLGYSDAGPYLMRVQANAPSGALKEACANALSKIGASGEDVSSSYLSLAEKLYYGKSAIAADTRNPEAFIWYWSDQTGLTRKNVPQNVFAEIMAMRASEYALQAAGEGETGDRALSLWLAANYKRQVELGVTVDPTRKENQPNAHYYGVTSGPKYVGMALDRTLNDRDAAVSYEILRSAQEIVGAKTLNINGEGQSLVKALTSPDRRVRFEAAFALAAARPTEAFTGADMVVPLLGEALSQTGKPTVLIVAATTDKVNSIAAPLTEGGYTAVGATTASDAINAAGPLPSVDVVVVDSTLPSEQVSGILESLGTSPKLRGSARLALVQTSQSPFEELKTRDPLLSTSTATEPGAIKQAIEDARAKAGGLPIDPAVANDYSLRAADQLKAIGTTGGVYDLAAVKSTLLGSLSDARPEVVTAVGEVLGQYGDADAQRALLAKASNTETDPAIRISLFKSLSANAKQYGNMLPGEDTKELEKIVTDEADLAVRSAAAEARGALNLPAGDAKAVVLGQVQR
jgi:HEAT repeat protein